MRRRSHCPANDHRQVHQLDLFGPPQPTSSAGPTPAWRMLPEETRRMVTDLMAQLLLEHGRADRSSSRMERADDI